MLKIELLPTIDKEIANKLPAYVFEGEVRVIDGAEAVAEAVNDLSFSPVLGFDTETKPSFRKGEFHYPSLLQLSDDRRVYLFRLHTCGFVPELKNLLSDPGIIKVGVGIKDDIRFLQKLSDFPAAGFIDLQDYAEEFGISDKSFFKLMAIIYGVKVSKRQRVTNWESPELSPAQVGYAATDAWGALKMYEKLKLLEEASGHSDFEY